MKKWEKWEQQVAYESGGKRVPLSGAGVMKADVMDDLFLTECKWTSKNSYSISKKTMETLLLYAAKTGLFAKLELNLNGMELVILPKKVFQSLNNPDGE